MAEAGLTAGKVVLYGFLGAGVFVAGTCVACLALIGESAREAEADQAPDRPAVAQMTAGPTEEETRANIERARVGDLRRGLAMARAAQPVDSSSIVAAYESNELAADQRYKGRWLKVSGLVDRVGKDMLDDPYITLRGPRGSWSHVQCFLTESGAKAAFRSSSGQKVAMVGRLDGKTMNVVMKSCEFE